MDLRPLALALLATSPLLGCASRGVVTTPPTVAVPETIVADENLEVGLNSFVMLTRDDPRRDTLRSELLTALGQVGSRALDRNDREVAVNALETGLTLWAPDELRRRGTRCPEDYTALAHRVYGEAARQGMEVQALLALATLEHFEHAQDVKVDREWAQLRAWIEGGADFERQGSSSSMLERTLEEIAARFPSPWVVEMLSGAYVERYEGAQRQRRARVAIDPSSQHRLTFSGYLLARTYLRADRFEDARQALKDYASDPASRELQQVIDRAIEGPRKDTALLELLEYFEPEDEDALPDYVIRQGWGIIEVVSRRALAENPEQGGAHLALAEAMLQRGLERAALHEFRATLSSSDDIFEAWLAVAALEQRALERAAERDPEEALRALPAIEEFHRRAMGLWRDRPVAPGLPRAYITIGESLYDAGDIPRARELLESSIELEPRPRAVDLLGTIAYKQGRLDDATSSYESLLSLPFEDQYARLRWSIRARSQLGEIALSAGDDRRAQGDLRSALETLNLVLAQPNLDELRRSFWLTERARVLFFAGEPGLAMQDFRDAVSTAPDRPLTYADPLLFTVTHGFLDEALEIFRQAVRHELPPQLELYFALWVSDLCARRGITPPPDAARIIDTFDEPSWIGALAAHARGELSASQLEDRATDRGQQAEAAFYEGLRAWRTGDREGGLARMRRVLESGMMSFFEFEMAQAYVRWGTLPADPRSPTER